MVLEFRLPDIGEELVKHDDPNVRRRLAKTAGRFRDGRSARILVEMLEDADASVRDEALESLYVLSGGRTLDYSPEADPAEQGVAIERWRRFAAHFS